MKPICYELSSQERRQDIVEILARAIARECQLRRSASRQSQSGQTSITPPNVSTGLPFHAANPDVLSSCEPPANATKLMEPG
ncbi:hypothetical protein Q31b_37740 [Novipirellula aureliae]|uniref:Uncharacterized protein n=1 Tax=Novipirellula aureliae TaxID=2527966 RepID=A0A5C6DUH6_9BACT|nr:hypothetical protein [Novipirellula aureliae]TWU38696.1 hypothetical protein Q31b_37740 [Novipirellula aureliae]